MGYYHVPAVKAAEVKVEEKAAEETETKPVVVAPYTYAGYHPYTYGYHPYAYNYVKPYTYYANSGGAVHIVKKREAEAEAEADPNAWYGYAGYHPYTYGYGYGYYGGYYGGYRGYYYGK